MFETLAEIVKYLTKPMSEDGRIEEGETSRVPSRKTWLDSTWMAYADVFSVLRIIVSLNMIGVSAWVRI